MSAHDDLKDRALLLALSSLSQKGFNIDNYSITRTVAKAIIDAIFDVIASPEE